MPIPVMRKRGVVQSQVFIYVLAALVFVSVLLFGYQALNKIEDRRCTPFVRGFGAMMQSEVDTIDFMEGSMVKRKYDIGCGIDKVYIVDVDRGADTYFQGSEVINNSISGEAQKNVFLLTGDIVEHSFLVDDYEIEFPYYICTRTIEGAFNLDFLSTGGAAVIRNGDPFLDCTLFSFMENISAEIFDDIDPEVGAVMLINQLKDKVNLVNEERTFDTTAGGTEVGITLTAQKGFDTLRHIEIIAKCLTDDVANIDFEYEPTMILNEDPLVMWEFEGVAPGEEIEISYKVGEMIDELCKNFVNSMAGSIKDKETPISHVILNQDKDLSEIILESTKKKKDKIIIELAELHDEITDLPVIEEESYTYEELVKKIDELERKIWTEWKKYNKIIKKQPMDSEDAMDVWDDLQDLIDAWYVLKSEFRSRVD